MLQDDNRDVDEPANTLEYFLEYEQVLRMIDMIKPIDDADFERDYDKFKEILTRYQEQPHLLDPHLGDLLRSLLTIVRDDYSEENLRHAAFKYLYIITKVRTYKALVKCLPHDLRDLEFALEMLEKQNPREESNWETRYILLLWLSILVLNPFHMSRLDAYESINSSHESNSIMDLAPAPKTKMERIYDLCTLYTAANDACSNVSAYLSAKYLVRADITATFLAKYFNWVIDEDNESGGKNVKLGQLAAVAAILKHGKREDLLPYADKLLQWITSCNYKQGSEFLQYKLYIKIIQRIGLVYLKPRIAHWRYSRGTRSLASNLTQETDSNLNGANSMNGNMNNSDDNDEEEEIIIVPDAIEEVIEELLQGLRSAGSDIRWNAAKGIGRVTNRLPKELADEVIGSVIDYLNPLEPHEAWHGACLALAELAKRGLLLPYRLTTIVPLLMRALFYDEMKGYMSVGSHIRDAACYMCWAFARAYNPDDLEPFVKDISAGLLTVATFDREINCRRAASAAFQESVGRLGNFPHGIEICTETDFYAVGLRHNAYLNISYFITQYDEYRQPLIDHLVQHKVGHWDNAIRELTAKTFHKLCSRAPQYMASSVLPALFSKNCSMDINTRHGSVLAIGEITLALSEIQKEMNANSHGNTRVVLLNDEITTNLVDLMGKFLKRDMFRGMSGEIMKQCCTEFIKNCCRARIRINDESLEYWQQIITKCLINKTATIRESAASAFLELCVAYYNRPERDGINNALVNSYVEGANNNVEEYVRMGYVTALGALPRFMIQPQMQRIFNELIKHSLTPMQTANAGESKPPPRGNFTHLWSEARRDSVKALCQVVNTVGYDSESEDSFGNSENFDKVIECLLNALDEYTLDNRGDVGAWVREAAMTALQQIVSTCPQRLLKPDYMHKIICGFMQQAVEKIDRVRGIAGRLLCMLIHASPELPHIARLQRLKEIFPSDENSIVWSSASESFPLLCELLELPEYSKRVLLGLTASIGQLTESLIKYSSMAFFQFLRKHPNDISRICREIVEIFEENLLNERVTYTLLSFLDITLKSGMLSNILVEPDNTFADDIFRLVNQEIKGNKKLYKRTSSINVYCQLVQVPRLSKRVLSKMAIFLGSTHVHIRKTTAGKLYEALALHGEQCDVPKGNLEKILNLLTETDWGVPLVEIRPIRNELCTLMDVKPPVGNTATSSSS